MTSSYKEGGRGQPKDDFIYVWGLKPTKKGWRNFLMFPKPLRIYTITPMNFLVSLKKYTPKLTITSLSIWSRTIFTDIGSNVQLRQSSGKSNTFSILCGTHINLLVIFIVSVSYTKGAVGWTLESTKSSRKASAPHGLPSFRRSVWNWARPYFVCFLHIK